MDDACLHPGLGANGFDRLGEPDEAVDSRWDLGLIERGLAHLARSATGDHVSQLPRRPARL
jgi:hypothetical protein